MTDTISTEAYKRADVVLVTPPTEKERAAAAALERLRGYAVHDGDCLTGAWPPQCCSCGLAELLKELGDD
jgi:hypothetical protein